MRRLRIVATVVTLLAALVPGVPVQAASDPGPTIGSSSQGLTVTDVEALTPRTTIYWVSTAALRQPVRVVVTLPEEFDADQQYPVLYLMHGTSGNPTDWVTMAGVEQTTAGRDLIVVAPDAGYAGDGGGWFVNWWNFGLGGTPRWEDFHLGQVVPWVDASFPTVATRDGRAIGGASQGGFGAMHAIARHPDLFTSVGLFSGAPTIYRDLQTRLYATAIIEGTTVLLDGAPLTSMFGDQLFNAVHWQGHDPAYLIDNLQGAQIEMWVGNGAPGALDNLVTCCTVALNVIEHATYTSTHAYARFLDAAGADYRLRSVNGTHSWPYWTQNLAEYVDIVMERFATPTPPPASVTYRTIESTWTQWGWNVSWARGKHEAFTTLRGATAKGFTLEGSGTATVVTPGTYAPSSKHTVRYGSVTRTVKADSTGRLTITLPVAGTATVTVT